MKLDLTCDIGRLKLDTCVYNASGPNDETLEQLKIIAASKSSAVLMKSCTLDPRDGNPVPRYKDTELGSINSMGLPNAGYKKYAEFAVELKKKWNKPVIASVSGMAFEDNITIVEHFNKFKEIDLIEFNPGSPNTIGRPIAGYDFDFVDKSMAEFKKNCEKPWGVKLPPYFDFWQFEKISEIINRHKPSFVATINSIGNALIIDWKKEQALIKPKGGFGGLGGDYIKPTALANVRKLYELLDKKIAVIGVGGVKSGVDVFEYVLCGATAVQVGTTFMKEGPRCFERIQKELGKAMAKKSYSSLEDFRGNLKML